MISRLFQHRFLPGRRTQRIEGVFSASELERFFHLERARVDRNGQVFSTVVFARADRGELEAMVEVVRDRVRNYDVLGRLDAGRLAVLLPDTDSEGAWSFADKTLAALAERDLSVNCEVYSYPADWSDQDAETAPSLSLVSDDEREPERAYEDAPRSTGTDDALAVGMAPPRISRTAPATHGLARVRAGGGPRAVHGLESRFHQPLSPARRLVDIIVSGTALSLLSPVLLAIAAAVKITSPGPIIFRQRRAGRGGVPFTFYKFRSMYIDAEERKKALAHLNEKNGPIFKMKNDPRMTPVGRFLRRASLDELPQLFNVLKGDMTLIGPRPPTLNEVERYERWQRRRLDITGGLTCIWQVSGRSEVGFEEWVRMDLEYQRKRSFVFDVKLLFRTVGAVLSGRGAY